MVLGTAIKKSIPVLKPSYLRTEGYSMLPLSKLVAFTITHTSKHNKLLNTVIFLFLLAFSAQAQNSSHLLSEALTSSGFENTRIKVTEETIYVALEATQYRWNVKGLQAALDLISQHTKKNTEIAIVLLKKGIPKIAVSIPAKDWENFRHGTIPTQKAATKLKVSYQTSKFWTELIKAVPKKDYDYKTEIVIYPQVAIQNTKVKELYESQFNLAPALELSLWKGMLLTSQIIFPIYNELGEEGSEVRPGFITLSQSFRLSNQWHGRLTTGNFNEHRYGADLFVEHPFKDNHFAIAFYAGITGTSQFSDGQWTTSKLNTITWLAKAQYFYPFYNLQFDLCYGKFLNNDYGFRVDCTRHFGETAIGFYALHSDDESTGGFHISIPIPPRKHKNQRSFRIRPTHYFDWTYNAKTDFNHGHYYETRPNENRTEHWLNPLFIKDQLLKIK